MRHWPAPLACACLLLVACARSKPLPMLGEIPGFQLTAQTGEPFDSKTLAGHVWVADFIYTTCPGPCPMMSSKMNRLQTSTAGSPEVKLVSFTVDPAHDTPPVLAEYAAHFKAQSGRWYFLTGNPAGLNRLGLEAFHLNAVDGSLEHSTRFVLVDGRGRIRGYYASTDEGLLRHLVSDILRLEREPS
jgi:protein SCO1